MIKYIFQNVLTPSFGQILTHQSIYEDPFTTFGVIPTKMAKVIENIIKMGPLNICCFLYIQYMNQIFLKIQYLLP